MWVKGHLELIVNEKYMNLLLVLISNINCEQRFARIDTFYLSRSTKRGQWEGKGRQMDMILSVKKGAFCKEYWCVNFQNNSLIIIYTYCIQHPDLSWQNNDFVHNPKWLVTMLLSAVLVCVMKLIFDEM